VLPGAGFTTAFTITSLICTGMVLLFTFKILVGQFYGFDNN
jgi:hypothetical protein